ncbi:extracellular catalytic domain type 1 short-chain-length polyhydroxyalkanoate depolymerase [Pseudonocardia asaccharolytica]|uniref:Esterase n=1 Tax=Pseudonocardia asaccharolytica DSM 44247 = NBRC 16224 TaxID=1123024 RepID=A0A511D0Q7_9PSEU|nr:PHB depolymerase family esterase [Pseudonocardia asaccharolytica]GEL18385.1 esterase [Pseudonocardia asaccharolytica DSM 44247 = NBRC 16224]
MDHQRMAAMAEATRLTREGRLTEATALIQRTLHGRPVDDRSRGPGAGSAGPGPSARTPAALRWLVGRRPTSRPSKASVAAPPAGLTKAPRLTMPDLRNLPGLTGLASGLPDLAPTVPTGPILPGETLSRTYRGPAGERPYTLYVPSGWTGQPVPLIVMLHGGTQTPADFAAATLMNERAEEHTFLVVYPEQVTSANPGRYWNWFQPGDQRRGAGEPSLIAGITGQVLAEHPADPDRVYVAGFSAGAAMAAVMAATHPDVFAAAGVHSGLGYGAARDLVSAFAAMRQGPLALPPLTRTVPVITFHGDADTVVSPVNAARVVEQFAPAGTATTVREHGAAGRSYSRTQVQRAGRTVAEQWTVHGSGHAWSGGATGGSYTDPDGPDASAEMVRFFAGHSRTAGQG